MFRVLLIVGLLFAGAHQGLARGDIELAGTEAPVFMTMDQAVAQLQTVDCCSEAPVSETKSTHCKSSSECKAVISTAYLVPFKAGHHPDFVSAINRSSVAERLEPRPPNS